MEVWEQQQRARPFQQMRHLGVGDMAALEDEPTQHRAAVEHLDGVPGLPSTVADQHEARGLRSELRSELPPQIEQQQVVFARLDGADADEIGFIRRRRAIRRHFRQVDAKRRYQHDGGSAAPVEVRLESVAGRRRTDNYRVGQGSRCLDSPAVPQILTGPGVFGKLHRDQIVDQADKPHAAASLEPGDQPAPFEMVVRDEKIDWLVDSGSQLRMEGVRCTPQRRKAQPPRQPPHPPLARRRCRCFPPHRGDRRDVFIGGRPLQESQSAPGCHRREAQRGACANQMFGIGEFNPVDPGRRPASGARQQARDIEYDHRACLALPPPRAPPWR